MNALSSLLNFIKLNIGVVKITQSSVSSLPITISDSCILAKYRGQQRVVESIYTDGRRVSFEKLS